MIFRPIDSIDGYLPIEDHGFVSDGRTGALIGRDGAVAWLCIPRFDSAAVFCRILDAQKGGALVISPEEPFESRQYYVSDSGVLVTEMRTPTGLVQITDLLTLRSGADLTEDVAAARGELLRFVRLLEGKARLHVLMEPRGGAESVVRGDGWHIKCASFPEIDLQLQCSRPLEGLRTTHELHAGETFHLMLKWNAGTSFYSARSPSELIDGTIDAWRNWLDCCFSYEGPQQELVRRSAVTIKMMDYFENGAIVASPTSSLPEKIGGRRNWDYRYSWIRDAAFSVYALRRIGLEGEAWGFLAWVLGEVEGGGRPSVLYTIDGKKPELEREDRQLEGYRRSSPVRWGNAAADQKQHDIFGELLDCAYQWVARGGKLTESFWHQLCGYVETARREWNRPDQGIWEVRTPGRPFTYSAALCQVALDRGARIAEMLGMPGDIDGWRRDAAKIRDAVLEKSWDPEKKSLTEHLGGGGLDASLLTLPMRRIIAADHPQMVSTVEAVVQKLGAGNGLLYRYLPDESPDGLPGHEGAFLLCSFWLVDNWAHQGRLDEAVELYDSVCRRANPLGLLPEQIDPTSGAFLGNYPQAFSHVGVIASGITLSKLMKKKDKPG